MIYACATFGLFAFFPGVFLSSRVSGACPVTTGLIMRVNVRTTTIIWHHIYHPTTELQTEEKYVVVDDGISYIMCLYCCAILCCVEVVVFRFCFSLLLHDVCLCSVFFCVLWCCDGLVSNINDKSRRCLFILVLYHLLPPPFIRCCCQPHPIIGRQICGR